MHNLHILVTRAHSATQAEDDVKSYLDGWGDEDNWRTICGSVSQDNEVHDTLAGRYRPAPTLPSCPEGVNP